MGIRFWVDVRARIVQLHYSGTVSIDDFTLAMEAVFRDPGYQPGFGMLVDRRNADPPTPEYVNAVIDFAFLHERELAGARWALVTASPEGLEMGRLGEQMAQRSLLPHCGHIFEDREAAENWLRLTDG